jgi:dienelactone hydrolase
MVSASVAFAAIGSALAFITTQVQKMVLEDPLSLLYAILVVGLILFGRSGSSLGFACGVAISPSSLEAASWALNDRLRLTGRLGRLYTKRPRVPTGSKVSHVDLQLPESAGSAKRPGMKLKLLAAALFVITAARVEAKVKTETFEYKHGDTVLEGYIAYDDAMKTKRPGVLVVHEWMGPNAYQKKRADMLAELGYVAFAVDVYGKGTRPKNHDEAGKAAGMFRSDRTLMRARMQAAADRLKQHPMYDGANYAAIGYCFGGTSVLEHARAGAPVKAVVSFHGSLDTPKPDDAKNIKARVQAHHGAADGFVPPEVVAAFQKEMTDAKVDWELDVYGGAVHSFTVKEAGNDPSKGMAYNEAADRRSWESMKDFLAESLKPAK